MNQPTDCRSIEFDYQSDFRQFLEEARNRTARRITNAAHLQQPGNQQLDGEKQSRKWWKSSMFSWLKTGRKYKPDKQPAMGNKVIKPIYRHCSGPVTETLCGNGSAKDQRAAASGPLSAVFSSTRGEEYEVPYMCLDKPKDGSRKIPSYGPIYLVT